MKGKKRSILLISLIFIILITMVSAKIGIEYYCDVTKSECKSVDNSMTTLEDVYFIDVDVFFYQYPEEKTNSMLAALALECADAQGAFDEYKEVLVGDTSYLREDLKIIANDLDLAESNFSFCLDSRERAFKLNEDIERGENIGVTTNPTVFIHGEKLEGLMSYEEYEAIVKEKLGFDEVIVEEEEEIIPEEEIVEVVYTEEECSGCESDDLCLQIGVRKEGLFCGFTQLMETQKATGEVCENNYECSSNECIDSVCTGEEPGFFGRVLNWFKGFYSV